MSCASEEGLLGLDWFGKLWGEGSVRSIEQPPLPPPQLPPLDFFLWRPNRRRSFFTFGEEPSPVWVLIWKENGFELELSGQKQANSFSSWDVTFLFSNVRDLTTRPFSLVHSNNVGVFFQGRTRGKVVSVGSALNYICGTSLSSAWLKFMRAEMTVGRVLKTSPV